MAKRYPIVEVAGQMQQLQAGDSLYGNVPFGRRNAVMNGNFDVWQRGTTFTSPANATFLADRWFVGISATAVVTNSQSTDVPTVAQSGVLSNFSLKTAITTSQASFTGSQNLFLLHRVEGYTWAAFAQRQLTLSFWVKSPKTGVHCVALRNSGNDRSYVAEYTVNVANTWEKKTINVTASPAAGTWDYTINVGISICFTLAAGATLQGTGGAWQSSNIIATSNQVNVADSNSNNFLLSQIQLEIGTIATDYQLVSFIDEFQQCQRYYCKTFDYATAPATGTGVTGALFQNDPSGCSREWRFPVIMRAAPTITTFNPVSANNNWRDTTNNVDRGTPTQQSISESNFVVVNAGLISTNNYIHITASAEL